MIFFFINSKKQIIVDTGHIKSQLLLFGLLLYFISLNFNKFLNYGNCALHFILRHSGILLIYAISLIYIASGFKIGMNYKEMERLNLPEFKNGNNNEKFDENNNDSKTTSLTLTKEIILNIEKELNNLEIYNNSNQGNRKSSYYLKKSNLSVNSKNDESSEKVKLNKCVAYIHSLYIELTFIYISVVNLLIILSLFSLRKKKEYIHEYNGKWRYLCPLENYDMIANLIEFLLIFYLMLLILKIWNYTYIFKCIKYIGNFTILWVTLGPLINVNRLIIYIYINNQ